MGRGAGEGVGVGRESGRGGVGLGLGRGEGGRGGGGGGRCLRLLEGGLERLQERVVLLLGVGHGLLELGQLRVALARGHGDVLLQLLLLRVVAVLHRVHRAARAELGRGELAERVEVAAALVVLTLLVGGVEVPAGEGDVEPMSNDGRAPGLPLGLLLRGGGGAGLT